MLRHVVTLDDLTETEIQAIFALADEFLAEMAAPGKPFRVRGRKPLAEQFILATMFYEASTRTRFSFESAMLRLGGQILSSADPKSTSAAKGETLADTVRIVQNYADLVIIRHPCDGAVRVAADYADVPVINAGDGLHEHPTQTLCDLYTLQREKGTLKNLNVMLCGDLKHGRTVHSLVYGLARFGARIIPSPAEGLGLPEHVRHRLLRDYDCVPLSRQDIAAEDQDEFPADVVYVTPSKPHQTTLFTALKDDSGKPLPHVAETLPRHALAKIDAFYVTRLQKERLRDPHSLDGYPVVDQAFLKNSRYQESRVLHPLPRVGELGYDVDDDERAVYFKQASYGVPVRMALIAALLELKPGLLGPQGPIDKHYIYSTPTLSCDNPNCITTQDTEQRYLKPRFWVILEEDRLTVRCLHCEHEMVPDVVGRSSTKKYFPNQATPGIISDDLVFFADEPTALSAGYTPHKQKVRIS